MIIQVDTREKKDALEKILFGFEVWEKIDGRRAAVRFCTSWATTDEAVDALIARL